MQRLRDPRLTDALLGAGLATILQLQLALGDHTGNAILNAAGGLLLTLALAVRRTRPAEVAGVYTVTAVATSLLGGGLFVGEPPPFACLIAGAVTFYSLGAYAEDRIARAGAALGVAGMWITVIGSDHADVKSFLFSGGFIVATPWLIGRNHRERLQRVKLREEEALQRERVAVGEERARIARELHDVVAHSVGGMVAQAQGAQRVLDRDPERAREALEQIERTGRDALDEMRRSLGVLRRTDADAPLAPQPGLRDVGVLVDQARASGLVVDLTSEGEPAPLPAGVDLSAYRIVQEALTNARKHAGPVRARVAVRYGAEAIEVEIVDEGPPRRAPSGGSEEAARGAYAATGDTSNGGQGLVGMRERVALYGGALHAGPRPEGGFVVRATLPLKP